MKKDVPTGIKVISVYSYLLGLIFSIMGFVMLAAFFFKDLMLAETPGPAWIGLFFLPLALFWFLSASFSIVLGINLWKIKKWARNILIGLSGVSIWFGILSPFMGDYFLSIFYLATGIPIFIYLLRCDLFKKKRINKKK
jgi:hypothetical protein